MKDQEHKYKQKKLPSNVSNQSKLLTNNTKPYIHHQKPHTPNLNSINQTNNNNNKISLRSGHLIKKSTTKNPQDPQNPHQNQYYQNDHSHNQTNSNQNQTSFIQHSDSFGVTKSFNTNIESKNQSIILQDKKYDSKQNSNQNSKQKCVKQEQKQKQQIGGNGYNIGKKDVKYKKKQGSYRFEQQNNSKDAIKKDTFTNNAHTCESNIDLSTKNHINSHHSQTNSTTTYQKNHRTPSNSIITKNKSLLVNLDNNKVIYKNNFNTPGSQHHSTMTISNQSYFTSTSIPNRNNNQLQNSVPSNTIKFHKDPSPYYGGGNLEDDYIRVNSIYSNQNSNNTIYHNTNQLNNKHINQNPSSNYNTNLTNNKGVNFNINKNINNSGDTRNYKISSQLQPQCGDMNNNKSFMANSYDNNSSNMIYSGKSIAVGQTQVVVNSLPSFLTKKTVKSNNPQSDLAVTSIPQNAIKNNNQSSSHHYNKKQYYNQSYKQAQNVRQQRHQNILLPSFDSNNTKITPNIDYPIKNYGYSNSFHQKQQYPNNSKFSMTVRNFQYGKKLDTETGYERTKSHNKNYSSHQFDEYQRNYNYNNRGENFHGNNQSLTQNHKYQNIPTTYSQNHQQPHNSTSKNSSFHYNQSVNSFTSSTNHNANHSYNQPYQNSANNKYAMSYNAKIITTNHNQKTYILDSIAEKDQFNKVFVRNNQQQKPQDKGFLQTNNASVKYLHRHNKQGSVKKINVISDQLNTSINPKSNQQQQNFNANYLNLKYIKTPINNKEQKNASTSLMMKSVPAQNCKNYQKYLKVNYQQYQPVSMSKSNSKIIKQSQRLNNDSKSMNSSFNTKDNKSQAHSVHSVSKKTDINSFNFTDSNDNNQTNIRNYAQYNLEGDAPYHNNNSNKQKYYYQNPQINNKREEMFRKTMDSGYKLPKFKNVQNQRNQNYSFGFDELREKNYMDDYENKDAQNRHQKTYKNQPFYRLNSPQPTLNHMDQNSDSNFYYGSPQNRQPNVITLFSPSQKNSKPSLKNHFLTQKDGQNQNNRQNAKHKKSIKKMLVSQSKYGHPKSQILYSLNFKDLKGEYQNSRPNSRTLLDALTKSQFARIFCSTFKIGQNQNGCDCIPKCFWVDQWILKLGKLPPNISLRSLMKNVNSNTLPSQFYNSQHKTLFKNNKSNEAISFKDFNTVLPNQDIQTFKQIQKDIPRTCSDHQTFKNDKYQQFLRQLLINFYYLDKKLGYVQGMNIIAAGIVYHSKTVHESLQLMDYVMNILKYRQLFQNDMSVCKQISSKTCKIIRHYCYDMYNYVML